MISKPLKVDNPSNYLVSLMEYQRLCYIVKLTLLSHQVHIAKLSTQCCQCYIANFPRPPHFGGCPNALQIAQKFIKKLLAAQCLKFVPLGEGSRWEGASISDLCSYLVDQMNYLPT